VTETSWLESTGVCTCCVQHNQADGSFARQKPNVRTLNFVGSPDQLMRCADAVKRTVKKETLLV